MQPGVMEAGFKEQPELYTLVLQGKAVSPSREHLQVWGKKRADDHDHLVVCRRFWSSCWMRMWHRMNRGRFENLCR